MALGPALGLRRGVPDGPAARLGLVGFIAALLLTLAAPGIAKAATFAQARADVRAWQLNPPPLFPSQLPAGHRGVNVALNRYGDEFKIYFGAPDNRDCHTLPNPDGWCVELVRWAGENLAADLPHDPDIAYLRRVRVGNRTVWFYEDEANAGGWWMEWEQLGRTYLAWAWVENERTALRRLTPFVNSLQPLTIPSATAPNWSGYVSLNPPSKTPVSARVTLPTVACTTSGSVSMWVGYDGWTSNTVEQDGVSAVCSHVGGQPSFHIWWELFKGSCFLSICYSRFYDIDERPVATSYTLAAGDSVGLSVARLAPRFPLGRDKIDFRISAYDARGHPLGDQWQKTVTEPLAYNAKYSSSECVLEAPGTASGLAALPNFGQADFANCSIIDDAASATDLRSVNMVRNGITLTTTEGVTVQDDFAVDWEASS